MAGNLEASAYLTSTAAIVEKFKALIEKNGKVESVEDWGVKKLAYEINYIREGHYVLVNFEAAAEYRDKMITLKNMLRDID